MERTKAIVTLEEDTKVIDYKARLSALRRDGVNRIGEQQELIASIRKSKQLGGEEKAKRIAAAKAEIVKAREVARQNRNEVAALQKEALAYVNETSKVYETEVTVREKARIAEGRQALADRLSKIEREFAAREESIKSSVKDPKEQKLELEAAAYEKRSAVFDAKNDFQALRNQSNAAMFQAFVDHVSTNRALRNGKSSFSEDRSLAWKNYKYSFSLNSFLLANGLYIAIGIFFVVCVILAPGMTGSNLFTLPNVLTILEQSSTRMFYALGVAGLILLAGTDLSVGRMVALGSVITGLLLHPGKNIVTFFGKGPWDFSAMPMSLRVVEALALSIVLCVAFSAFAGFFSAKMKMHPFISTLATQLIIYGLLFYGTSGTPVGSIDSKIKDAIGGRWLLGYTTQGLPITFPKLIIPAVVAIIVAWFIWNKTVFGKNMYAVGGNSEAAAVSGINVFRVTMGVFIMAGIFYGCGAFLEAFRANASAGTGQGYELDAIAACVVGGISFNGGIGKIGGAAIGVIIFTSLTYCLTFLGIDTNLQFVFKGIIIVAAVSLDSVKYLKKK